MKLNNHTEHYQCPQICELETPDCLLSSSDMTASREELGETTDFEW